MAALIPVVGLGQTQDAVIKTCTQCHGSDGVSDQPHVAHLNGQLADAFIDTLAAYANRSRPTTVPAHTQLPKALYADIANFYAAHQDKPRPRQATDPARVEKGALIYGNRCEKCHVDNGRESDGEAPRLAAQNLEFLVNQTLAYKAGVRKLPFMMDRAYAGLSEDDLVSVAHFFAAQDMHAPAVSRKKHRRSNN